MRRSGPERQAPLLSSPDPRRRWIAPLLAALLAGCASGAPHRGAPWPDSYVRRLGAQALLQDLNARLLSHDSATATLERWCDIHHLASQPVIRAQRIAGADKPAAAVVRRELQVTAGEVLRYRHVRLQCGSTVMSEADNWYVPSRLTPAMNLQLDTTDQPFGRVVQSLAFRRITREVEVLWQPLPEDWDRSARTLAHALAAEAASPGPPPTLFRHRAVLVLGDGTPFSYVVEDYQAGVLGGL